MPAVEITQLRLKRLAADDPLLLESLSQVRRRLQTNSRFFSCIHDSSLIYIFGFWPSLDAHLQFLASPARDEVLGPQEEILDFQWTIHLDLETIGPSFFDAPLIAVRRLEISDSPHAYNDEIDRHVRKLQTGASSNAIFGWRCDLPTGSYEAAILNSWTPEGPVNIDIGRQINPNSDDVALHRQILFHRAQNMERMQSPA